MEKKQLTPLKIAISTLLLDSRSRRLSPKTIRFYVQQLGWFLEWITPYTEYVEEVNATHIRTYMSKRADDGLAPASVSAIYRALGRFFSFCVEEEFIEVDPMAKIKRPRVPEKIPPAFTKSEINKILKICVSRRDRCIVLVLVDSGVRASELIQLKVSDVDIDTGTVHVVSGKGGKERYTYIGLRTRKELLRYLAERGGPGDDDPLFLASSAEFTYSGLKSLMARLERDSGIEVYAHKFRHTCARWSLRSGMNIYAIQKMMGHATLDMLKRYAELEERDVRANHEAYGAVDSVMR